jgi:uncharacterized paraquat-inducible protein A
MKVRRAMVRMSELQRSFGLHLRWCCSECLHRFDLSPDDPRVGSGRCPACPRCGAAITVVISSGTEPS